MTTSERLALAVPVTPQQLRWVLTNLWTLKEGYTKAIGEGVGFGLERINVVLDELEVVRVEVDGRDLVDDGWKWTLGRIGEGMESGYAVYWKDTEWQGVEIVDWSQLVLTFDTL
jgi:4'-phosphopantetheinyl transferase